MLLFYAYWLQSTWSFQFWQSKAYFWAGFLFLHLYSWLSRSWQTARAPKWQKCITHTVLIVFLGHLILTLRNTKLYLDIYPLFSQTKVCIRNKLSNLQNPETTGRWSCWLSINVLTEGVCWGVSLLHDFSLANTVITQSNFKISF